MQTQTEVNLAQQNMPTGEIFPVPDRAPFPKFRLHFLQQGNAQAHVAWCQVGGFVCVQTSVFVCVCVCDCVRDFARLAKMDGKVLSIIKNQIVRAILHYVGAICWQISHNRMDWHKFSMWCGWRCWIFGNDVFECFFFCIFGYFSSISKESAYKKLNYN